MGQQVSFWKRFAWWTAGTWFAGAMIALLAYQHGRLAGLDSTALLLRGFGLIALALIAGASGAGTDLMIDKAKKARRIAKFITR
jgi:hypothetical protein